jgi:histidine ammonia-lyase
LGRRKYSKTAQVLEKHQLQPLKLQAKEGLALINGTQLFSLMQF